MSDRPWAQCSMCYQSVGTALPLHYTLSKLPLLLLLSLLAAATTTTTTAASTRHHDEDICRA